MATGWEFPLVLVVCTILFLLVILTSTDLTSSTRALAANAAVDIDAIDAAEFRLDGYVVAKGVFQEEEIDLLRERILELAPHEGTTFHPWYVPSVLDPGSTIPAFQWRKKFNFMHNITNHTRLQQALKSVFGNESYVYTGHNDIGIDRVVGYHKDRLNGRYRHYEKHDLWSHSDHMIVKAAIYLQSHSDNDDAMLFVPGSHLSSMDPKLDEAHKGVVRMHPTKGDVLIFEQRATHRGREWQLRDVLHTREPRILISLGYGLDNELTSEFAAGTLARQRDQCGDKCFV